MACLILYLPLGNLTTNFAHTIYAENPQGSFNIVFDNKVQFLSLFCWSQVIIE